MLHNYIRPESILLTRSGTINYIQLINFGRAEQIDCEDVESLVEMTEYQINKQHNIIGLDRFYISPE